MSLNIKRKSIIKSSEPDDAGQIASAQLMFFRVILVYLPHLGETDVGKGPLAVFPHIVDHRGGDTAAGPRSRFYADTGCVRIRGGNRLVVWPTAKIRAALNGVGQAGAEIKERQV